LAKTNGLERSRIVNHAGSLCVSRKKTVQIGAPRQGHQPRAAISEGGTLEKDAAPAKQSAQPLIASLQRVEKGY
jgi:hypothetical protein